MVLYFNNMALCIPKYICCTSEPVGCLTSYGIEAGKTPNRESDSVSLVPVRYLSPKLSSTSDHASDHLFCLQESCHAMLWELSVFDTIILLCQDE